jgi:hypothetical protein
VAGSIKLAKGSQPATPASGYTTEFVDTEARSKTIDANGILSILSDHSRYNYIRNSGFWFAQRQVPGTLTTYSNTSGRAFAPDGWAITNENASCQYIRNDTIVTPETGLQGRFYGSFTKITATGKFVVSQCIEGVNSAALRGRSVRVQCWMKATASMTVRLGLVQLNSSGTVDTLPATYISAFGANSTDPTLGTNLAYIAPKSGVNPDNATTSGNAASCSVTTSWQRFGAVFDVPSNCRNVVVQFWTDSQVTATNGFSLAQVVLSDGYEIQDWSPQSYSEEIDRVKRFYQKSFLIDTNPAQNVGVNTGEIRGVAGKAGAVANSGFIMVDYPVGMRATPGTNTIYNPAAANALARNITGAADMGTTTITGATANGFYLAITGVAATAVGDLIAIHYSSDAEL